MLGCDGGNAMSRGGRVGRAGGLGIGLLLAGTLAAETVSPGACVAVGAARPVCEFQNPEDLAVLPGDAALLVSEYGAMQGGQSGRLSLYVLADDERRTLFSGGDAEGSASEGWGEASCPGPPPPAFSPHGIDLGAGPEGRLALAVVQHGGRESIELFEVTGEGVSWTLTWRGCIVAPEGAWLNEVAWLPGGELVTTHMMPRDTPPEALTDGSSDPGHVYHWSPASGFRELPGTRGGMPNGISVSKDGRTLFLNLSMASEVRRIDRATGMTEASAPVSMPDNSTWAPDGRLLVASLRAGDDTTAFEHCQTQRPAICPIPFAIVALDPDTLEPTLLYENDPQVMGAGTVGLQVGGELFVGTFSGNRLLRVRLRD
jgi:hypothetical protein